MERRQDMRIRRMEGRFWSSSHYDTARQQQQQPPPPRKAKGEQRWAHKHATIAGSDELSPHAVAVDHARSEQRIVSAGLILPAAHAPLASAPPGVPRPRRKRPMPPPSGAIASATAFSATLPHSSAAPVRRGSRFYLSQFSWRQPNPIAETSPLDTWLFQGARSSILFHVQAKPALPAVFS